MVSVLNSTKVHVSADKSEQVQYMCISVVCQRGSSAAIIETSSVQTFYKDKRITCCEKEQCRHTTDILTTEHAESGLLLQ